MFEISKKQKFHKLRLYNPILETKELNSIEQLAYVKPNVPTQAIRIY